MTTKTETAKTIAERLYFDAEAIADYTIETNGYTEDSAVTLIAHNGAKLLVETFTADPYADLPITWGEVAEDGDFTDLTNAAITTIEEGVQAIEAWAAANA